MKIGVFSTGWSAVRHWNDSAVTVRVQAAGRPPRRHHDPAPDHTTPPTPRPRRRHDDLAAHHRPGRARAAGSSGGVAHDPAARHGRLPGAPALRPGVPVGFRYQYLSGGVNTGNGWATWNPTAIS